MVRNVERSRQVVTVTAPLLALGVALLVAVGVQQVRAADPASRPTTSVSQPSSPTQTEPDGGRIALRDKTLPGTVGGGWSLRGTQPRLTDAFDAYYGNDNGVVSITFDAGDEAEYQRQVSGLEEVTTYGVATCGTNPNNNLDYCFIQGSDDTYLSLFSSSTRTAGIGALAQGVVAALS